MGRDSNPRYLAVYTLSRRAQSTTLPPIPLEEYGFIVDLREIDNECLQVGQRKWSVSVLVLTDFSKWLAVHRLEVYLEWKLRVPCRLLSATGRVGLPPRVGRVVLADFDAEV